MSVHDRRGVAPADKVLTLRLDPRFAFWAPTNDPTRRALLVLTPGPPLLDGYRALHVHPPTVPVRFRAPGSTLLALVSAFCGLELMRAAYETAVREAYRFYSYGDAMLIV